MIVESAISSGQSFAAARDLGHVIYRWGPSQIHVRWRPSFTSPASHLRLMNWLHNDRPQRAVLSYLVDENWCDEIIGPAQTIIQRIDQLMARYGGGEAGCARRELRSVRLDRLSKGFAEAIQYWRDFRDDFDPDRTVPILRQVLSQRDTLFECQAPGTFIMRAVGNGRPERVQKWMNRAHGLCIRSTPDSFFGRMCAEAYQEADRAFEPLVDDVDALTTWSGRGRLRHRFHRLILPFRSTDRRWIVTGYVNDRSIRLLA
jgi:hypothetical protein